MFIRAYLRASTDEQDAARAREGLDSFIAAKNKRIASYYQENESGTKTDRPKLNELLEDAGEGDILLIEKMDRLTRLPYEQWETLKARINDAGIIIVVVDQTLTHAALSNETNDSKDMAYIIQKGFTDLMLDIAAGMARDDYETRVKRQADGIAKAKELGKYKGRQIDKELHANIKTMLTNGLSYTDINKALGCSRVTISKVKKIMTAEEDG